MDNLIKQNEEIETLKAIYSKEFQTEDEENRKYCITIVCDYNINIYVKLYVKFPDSYPSMSPPTFEISAPHLKQEKKLYFSNLLNNIYLSYTGQNVVFQWVEKIREELQSLYSKSVDKLKDEVFTNIKSNTVSIKENSLTYPIIIHGEVISDKKSSFQGHAAAVYSIHEVKQTIIKLKENRKIQHATHNIYAFRIYNENNKNYLYDCDDDGEFEAGSKLLNLLMAMDIKNVLVIVSRWYGGIHLGRNRFKHINNAARQVLVANNFMSIKQKK